MWIQRITRGVIVITAPVCVWMLGGCTGAEHASEKSGDVGGTVVIAAPADPDNLFPPLTITPEGRQIVDQVFDYLADLGPSLNTVGTQGFTPRLADRWEWAPDSLSIAFHVNPSARWHDGKPVTAGDVRFTYQLVSDPKVASPIAATLSNVDSVSVRDSLTAVVWYKHRAPEQFFEVVYNLAILPEHLLRGVAHDALVTSTFARHPVGSGRFRFGRWDAGSKVELVSDSTNYRGRAKLDRVVWLVSPDMQAATTRFLAGEADFLDVIRGPTVDQVAKSPRHRLLVVPSLDYGYLGFNVTRPMFQDAGVRRALAMAVDRSAMVRNVFDTLAAVGLGPFTRAQPVALSEASGVPYDTVAARKVFAAHAKLPRFSILVPTSSAIRMKYATLLQEQYRKMGIEVTVDALELSAFARRLNAHDFDAVLNAWHTDPSPSSVRQAWGSASVHDGANFTGYANSKFDALVDSAASSFAPDQSRMLYGRADDVIVGDAPAIWLYESRAVSGISRRVNAHGGRPDAWWAGLPEWTVRH